MNDGTEANQVKDFVYTKTKILGNNSASSRAALAKLRRGVGKEIGACPEAWSVLLEDLDEQFYSKGGDPTYAENAIWTALTLYSAHQQGKADKNMSASNNSLGRSVGILILPDKSNEQSIRRRFNAVITAKNSTEIAQHARGLIQLLRSKDIALDYGEFAKDLYFLQFPDVKNKILLKWGEDSYRQKKDENTNKEEIEK